MTTLLAYPGSQGASSEPSTSNDSPPDAATATPDSASVPAAAPAQRRVRRPVLKPKPKAGPTTDAQPSDQNADDSLDPEALALAQGVTPEAVLEVKRRKAAFKVMMRLLEEGAADEETMTRMCAPLSGQEFTQVAEERSLAGQCGNPMCHSHVQPHLAQGSRWQVGPGGTVAQESGPVYCSAACRDLVGQYATMLGDPMQRMRPDARERLLVSHKARNGQSSEEVAAQVNGVTTMLANIVERGTVSELPTPQPAQGDSRAVEGYVPRTHPQQVAATGSSKPPPPPVPATQQQQPQPAPQPDSSASTSRSVNSQQPPTQKARGLSAMIAKNIASMVEDVSAPQAPVRSAAGPDTTQPANPASSQPHSQPLSQPLSESMSQPAIVELLDDSGDSHTSGSGAVSDDECESDSSAGFSGRPWLKHAPVVKPILKRHTVAAGDGGERVKKHVHWAEDVQEFTKREGGYPSTPMLVFTMDGSGADMVGGLGTAGGGSSAGSNKLAGRLEVQDAGSLSAVTEHAIQAAANASLGGGPGEAFCSGQPRKAEVGQLWKPPKALTLLLPPAAGGVGVPVRAGGGPPKRARKFTPRVPTARPRKAETAGTAQPQASVSQGPAHQTAHEQAQTLGDGSTLSASQRPASAGPRRAPAGQRVIASPSPSTLKIGRDPNKSKVVMLDTLPGRKPASADSASSTTAARPQASNRTAPGGPQRGSAPRGAGSVSRPLLAAVVPEPEMLPFEELDPCGGVGVPAAAPKPQVQVIRSDRPPTPHSSTSSQGVLDGPGSDSGEESDCSDASSGHHYQPEPGLAVRHPHSRGPHHAAIRHGSDDDGTESDTSSSSDSDGSGDDSDGQVAVRRRRVRGDVILEEDDEAAEAAVGDACRLGAEGHEEEQEGDADRQQGSASEEGHSSDEDAAYQAAIPFFGPPPKGYRVELSPFNMLWSLVSSWVTRETLSYMRAAPGPVVAVQQAGEVGMVEAAEDDSAAAQAVLVALPAPSVQSAQARAALAELLLPHLGDVLRGMAGKVGMGEVTKRVTGLLRTLMFTSALPSLSFGQWRLLALSVLRALSMARLPSLAEAFERQEGPPRLAGLLQDTGFELPHLSALVDLFLND